MKWSWMLILAVAAFMASCDKEQADSLTTTGNEAVDSRTVSNVEMVTMEVDGMEHGPRCFTLVFPVTVLYPNGDTDLATDAEALRGLFRAWREQNPNAMDRPTIQFPYQVMMTYDNTDIRDITSRDDLLAVLAECRENDPGTGPGHGGPGHGPGHGGPGHGPGHFGPGFGFNSPCFSLQYPVTVNLPGGDPEDLEVFTEEELRAAIQAWREANPGPTDQRPSLNMPYTVVFDDDTALTIEDEDDLQTLRETCQAFCPGDPSGPGNGPGFDGPGPLCFRLVFPVTVILPNGREIQANSRLALLRIRRAWRERNHNSDEHPTLGFPLTVTLEDGTQQVITDQAAFDALLDSCE